MQVEKAPHDHIFNQRSSMEINMFILLTGFAVVPSKRFQICTVRMK